ncbi:hypothetical protein JOF56_000849 [Kibdelosporangium banguiense]|uniref:DUF4373 domain-containing protein n=1 Tax=Kibdelosporangium banguiense TaxID=1365924 RepID=A0ABS4T7R2_9PSEU|nr:hypothetical protein [Kibdelosporangium banguiense]MBP2320464.1 hypothetical protein [Kibdelosporangium banguiense]
MARDHARLYVHIWTDDEDWKALSPMAKLLYLQLLSQKRLTYAGLLDLSVKRWARAHPGVPLDQLRAALSELDNKRFVVVDQDTEEVLIRTFIRNDELYKQPQVLAAALRAAFDIESPILRAALAVELRRLPVEVTGQAPAVAAVALEAGLREQPTAVKAAFADRRARRATPPPTIPTPEPEAPAKPEAVEPGRVDAPATEPAPLDMGVPPAENPCEDPSVDPVGHPSRDPSGQAQGEGSWEREKVVACPTLGFEKVGVPAPAPVHTRVSASAREQAPLPAAHLDGTPTDHHDEPGHDPDTGSGSVRQARRAEAERLVLVHTPEQPRRVLDRLRGEVIGLLAEGLEPAIIAAGLRIWASKTLATTMLPELVAEHMRAHLTHTSPAALTQDLATVAMFERVRADKISADDRSVIGEAVRAELPAHTTPAELGELMREAGQRALALAVAGSGS